MPIYDYRCENGHTFETIQSMSEDPLTTCEICGAPANRFLHAPAVHFKGSGFYTTDYARKGSNGSGSDSDSSGSSDSKEKSTSDSKSNGGSDSGSKSESKSASSSSGSSSSGSSGSSGSSSKD